MSVNIIDVGVSRVRSVSLAYSRLLDAACPEQRPRLSANIFPTDSGGATRPRRSLHYPHTRFDQVTERSRSLCCVWWPV